MTRAINPQKLSRWGDAANIEQPHTRAHTVYFPRYLKRASYLGNHPFPSPPLEKQNLQTPRPPSTRALALALTSTGPVPRRVLTDRVSCARVRVCVYVCAAVAVSGISLRNGTRLARRPPRIGLFIRCSLKLRVECQRKLEGGKKNLEEERFYMIVTAGLRWPEWEGDCRLLRSVSRSQCVCVCV